MIILHRIFMHRAKKCSTGITILSGLTWVQSGSCRLYYLSHSITTCLKNCLTEWKIFSRAFRKRNKKNLLNDKLLAVGFTCLSGRQVLCRYFEEIDAF